MASGKEVVVRFHFIPPQPRSQEDKNNVAEWEKQRAFYTCSSKKMHLSYMDSCSPEDEFDKTHLTYMGNKKKTNPTEEKSSGLFDRNGMLNIEKIKQHRQNLRENKGNIWYGVISFESGYGEKHCSTADQALKAMQKVFDRFLDSTHLSSEHIEWLGALHTNKEHKHIHFTFYEKAPYREMENGELKYSYKGNVENNSLDYLKQSIFRYFAYDQVNMYGVRDEIIKSIMQDFKDMSVNGQLFQDFKELAENLQAQDGAKYDDLSQQQKDMVDEFSIKIIKSDDELSAHYTDTFAKLAKAEEEIEAYDAKRKFQTGIVSRSDFFREDLLKRMGGIILKNTEYVSKRMQFMNGKLNDLYSSDLSDKAKFASIQMIKKGVSKEIFRGFKNTVRESSELVKNYHWLKIIKDKELEGGNKDETIY